MEQKRYYIVKSANMQGLKNAMENNIWACNDRKIPPQPKDILSKALEDNYEVYLIFSVNNCHGWHGYAKMTGKPGSIESNETMDEGDADVNTMDKSDNPKFDNQEEKNTNSEKPVWHRFPIKWHSIFLKEHGEKCLSFRDTKHLLTLDQTPVNKGRNFQEVIPKHGQEICELIDGHIAKLDEIKLKKKEDKIQKQPAAFFTPSSSNVDIVWNELLDQVEKELGKVLIACPFGSQRYNLSTADSDMDMFIVYQAPTHKLLGFDPPPHTVKSREGESCDYSIHEVHRFCQLLIGGDPRCTEMLFLHPSIIHSRSDHDTWNRLCKERLYFLNSNLLEKYLHDAKGAKGLKQWDKVIASAEQDPSRLNKLAYVIIRLLQNARDIALGEDLRVFRETGTKEHKLLTQIRQGKLQQSSIIEEINSLLQIIDAASKDDQLDEEKIKQAKEIAEKWMIQLRYNEFRNYKTKDT